MTRDEARKADSSLASARAEQAAGRVFIAVNRAYFAAFYAASAVLLNLGRKFVKHTGVRTSIHRDLVNEGRLDPQWGKAYHKLFENRMKADYLEHVTFEEEQAEALIVSAEDFVGEMCKLLGGVDGAEERVKTLNVPDYAAFLLLDPRPLLWHYPPQGEDMGQTGLEP